MRIIYSVAVIAALVMIVAMPWLAYQEAQRTSFGAESDAALGYARDLMHRADETTQEALNGLRQLSASGMAPCSKDEQALMRNIALQSMYIQAIGRVYDNAIKCSSSGSAALPLGEPTFRTSKGAVLYLDVPLEGRPSPLVGIGQDGFAALVHRDLPVDIWTAVPDVSLAIVQIERGLAPAEHGYVNPAWLSRLGMRNAVTFTDSQFLVAIVRSNRFLTASIAAIPIRYVEMRTHALAWRFVPAGLFTGLTAAAALLLLVRRQLSLHGALRNALRRGEFFLEYQPLVDLSSDTWVGVEALLRWRRSTGELISPDVFIPIAEQTGLVTCLTERVLQIVERDAGRFLATHPKFHVAVNLSAADLHSDDIVVQIDAILARGAIKASNLLIEITERAFVDPVLARGVLEKLHARGIEVAVDDFGTGYSSLQYLETLDLDFLKIDRSFIEAIGTGAPTSQVVIHIIAMAKAMSLQIIAEGIECTVQADYLRGQGVHYAQGWMYAKAMSFPELEQEFSTTRMGKHNSVDAVIDD